MGHSKPVQRGINARSTPRKATIQKNKQDLVLGGTCSSIVSSSTRIDRPDVQGFKISSRWTKKSQNLQPNTSMWLPGVITHALSSKANRGKTKAFREADRYGNPVDNIKRKRPGANRLHDLDSHGPVASAAPSRSAEVYKGSAVEAMAADRDRLHDTSPPAKTAARRRSPSPISQNIADESTTAYTASTSREGGTSVTTAENWDIPTTDIPLKQHVLVISECFGEIDNLMHRSDGGGQKQALRSSLWLSISPSIAPAPSWEDLRKDFNRAVWISRRFATTVAIRTGVLRKEIIPLLQDENTAPEKKQKKLARFLEAALDTDASTQEMLQILHSNLERMRIFRNAYDSSTTVSGRTSATASWALPSGNKGGKEPTTHGSQTRIIVEPKEPQLVSPVQRRDSATIPIWDNIASSSTGGRPLPALSPMQNEYVLDNLDEDDHDMPEDVKQAIAALLGPAKYDLIMALDGVDVTTAVRAYWDETTEVVGELLEKQKRVGTAEEDGTNLSKELSEYVRAHEAGLELLVERLAAIEAVWEWVRYDAQVLHERVQQARTVPELQAFHQIALKRSSMTLLYENLGNLLLDYANAVTT